jgi:hypothetical protein
MNYIKTYSNPNDINLIVAPKYDYILSLPEW